MILKNCSLESLFKNLKQNSLYCYGIGKDFESMICNFELPWKEKIAGLIDSSIKKQKEGKDIFERHYEIISIEDFLRINDENIVLLISCSHYYDIIRELNGVEKLRNIECYIYNFMCNLSSGRVLDFNKQENYKIPPIIHYCWFGRKELPDLYKRCIDSWRKYCPNYEIREWNEDNCDVNIISYTQQAYKCKKYGFVSDYMHLKIIYEHGGIYLDTDVELIKNIDDLRCDEAFCGMQYPGEVAFGLGFGAVKNSGVIKKLMSTYEKISFVNSDGTLNETTSPVYQTTDLRELGLGYGNKEQLIHGMRVYPTDVLCPINIRVGTMEITENTHAIHHFDGSWCSKNRVIKKKNEIMKANEIYKLFC